MVDSNAGASEEYLSPNKAGRIAGVTGEAVKQWIYSRKLPAGKLPNGYWRIKRDDLEAFLTRRGRPSPRRILLSSNDAALVKTLHSSLASRSYEVFVATNIIDTVLKALDCRPAAIVIDLSDSPPDGLALASKLRVTKGFMRTPMVFVATKSAASSIDIDEISRLDAQVLLFKPVAPKAFAAELTKLLLDF